MSAKDALQRGVKVAAASLDTVKRPPAGLVVLIYHRVEGGSGTEVDLPASLFDDQMAELAASGRVLTLGAALDWLAAPQSEDSDARTAPVVVTFDDGTADFAEVAVPILERHQIPATLYAATDFIDSGRSFPDYGTPVSWSALADAASTGLISVGSHTHQHLLLDRLAETEVAAELDRSIELIGQHLGVAPADFAYPKAVLGSPAAEAAIRARFRSAAVAGTKPNQRGAADPYRLARSPIQVADAMTYFRRKVAGGMGFEDQLRQLANRRRYASATS